MHPSRINKEFYYFVKRFSYSGKTKTFVTEASCLNTRSFNEFTRPLFSDAADRGFGIMNPETKKVVYFTFSHEDEDREGEVSGWNFVSIPSDVCKTELKCLIIND